MKIFAVIFCLAALLGSPISARGEVPVSPFTSDNCSHIAFLTSNGFKDHLKKYKAGHRKKELKTLKKLNSCIN